MKPIRINNNLYAFAKDFSSKLYDGKTKKYKTRQRQLNELRTKYSHPVNVRVLNLIIKYYENQELLYSKPNIHQRLVNLTDKYLDGLFYNRVEKKQTDFGEEIETALRYDTLQKNDAIKIVQHLKLNTCPYCNASLTVSIDKNDKVKPRFQLDHFFPKSKYPFLAISFFNLVPSCGQCNQSKSKSSVTIGQDFHLYSNETPYDAFQFKLNNKSLIEYLINGGNDSLSFSFQPRNKKHKKFVEKHDKTFGIKGLYDTQFDIVEELIWKSQYYTPLRINELGNLLRLSTTSIARMITGNYSEYENVHKRPLAKFTQDIARDLKLIK